MTSDRTIPPRARVLILRAQRGCRRCGRARQCRCQWGEGWVRPAAPLRSPPGADRAGPFRPGRSRAARLNLASRIPPRKPRGTRWGSTAAPQPPRLRGSAWNTSSRFSKTQQGLATSWTRMRMRTTGGTGPTCRPLWSRHTRRGWLPAHHPAAPTSPSSPARRSWWGPSRCPRGR